MVNILLPKTEYVIEYPQAISFSKRQSEIFWLPDEIHLEKDIHDIRTNLTIPEYEGIIYLLKLFTLYEVRVGGDYWRDYISKIFHRPEIERMASTFSFFELGVHAVFYNRINELLGFDTEEFYNSYKEDQVLANRIKWLGKRTSKCESYFDILKSLATFSMIEGAILYSSFAYLKHFNSNGKNKLNNINAGINFSVNDELIHSEAGAWLFKTLLSEVIKEDPTFDVNHLVNDLLESVKVINEHEGYIISNLFKNGNIEGITSKQLINFVESRLDKCLDNLGIKPIFKPKYNPISEWFYNDVNSSVLHDFFISQGSDYNRNWSERKFVW